MSRALAKLTEQEARAVRVRRYLEAYREQPETDKEIETAAELARRALG